jgi:hypothetical protein
MTLAITHVWIVSVLQPWNTPTGESHQQPGVNRVLMVALLKQMLIEPGAAASSLWIVFCVIQVELALQID